MIILTLSSAQVPNPSANLLALIIKVFQTLAISHHFHYGQVIDTPKPLLLYPQTIPSNLSRLQIHPNLNLVN